MKMVSSKTIRTAPFVERRLRQDLSNNKYRRAEDITPANIEENYFINSATYKFSLGKLEATDHNNPVGKLLDSQA